MPVEPDRMLCHYRLVEKIGEGGMGEVWRAEDTKLGRDVALKLLPAALQEDPDRVSRFSREARLLAALSHANIAAIHGFEQMGRGQEAVRFLVLELVPGHTLAERIASGPVPPDEALRIAGQIAEGLEAAHDRGIIHRDLKPANVKITPDGTVKILDFGLARVLGDRTALPDASRSPTVTFAGTRDGVILGTAGYMSPEQARGDTLDRRTDVWSFGCVLYEMLTGGKAFDGPSVPDILAAVLEREPDWSRLPSDVAPSVERLLRRSLRKDRRERLRDVGDAWIEIRDARSGEEQERWQPPSPRKPPSRPAVAAAGIAVFILGAGVWALLSPLFLPGDTGSPRSTVRVYLDSPDGAPLQPMPRVSPDGKVIAFRSGDPTAFRPVRLRRLDRYEITEVPDSEGEGGICFSPDGGRLAYLREAGSARRRLSIAPVDGSSPPVSVIDWSAEWDRQAFLWLPGETILTTYGALTGMVPEREFLVRIPIDGRGAPTQVAIRNEGLQGDLQLRSLLPGGRHALATIFSFEKRGNSSAMAVVDLETGEVKVLAQEAAFPTWSGTGHLLYTWGDTLMAAPFDPGHQEITGGAKAIEAGLSRHSSLAERWGFGSPGAWFDISRDGVLVYVAGKELELRHRVVLLREDGTVSDWTDQTFPFVFFSDVSRNARNVAFTANGEGDQHDIWVSSVDSPRPRLLVDVPGQDCSWPAWHPDEEHLLYSCWGKGKAGGLYIRRADGTDEPALLLPRGSTGDYFGPTSVSPDGKHVLLAWDKGHSAIVLLPLGTDPSGGREPVTLIEGDANWGLAKFSPDGRWIAYQSDRTGRFEPYVREFRSDGSLGPEIQLASIGGGTPNWYRDRNAPPWSIYFVSSQDQGLYAVNMVLGERLEISPPRRLFGEEEVASLIGLSVQPLPDGRFLAVRTQPDPDRLRRLHVVVNWDASLEDDSRNAD